MSTDTVAVTINLPKDVYGRIVAHAEMSPEIMSAEDMIAFRIMDIDLRSCQQIKGYKDCYMPPKEAV